MISEAVVGAFSGGILRLAPEFLRFFDRRSERRHELAVQQLEVSLTEKLWGKARSAPSPVFAPGMVDALRELHLNSQIDRAGKRFPFVDALAALVRPTTTWALLALYLSVRLVAVWKSEQVYGVSDIELLSTVLSYWFVSRTLEKK